MKDNILILLAIILLPPLVFGLGVIGTLFSIFFAIKVYTNIFEYTKTIFKVTS